MEIGVLINQLVQLFILMGVGYFLYKVKILDADFNKKLTNFVLKVTLPCTIVASVFNSSNDRDYSKVYVSFMVAIIMYLVLPVVGLIIAKMIRCKPESTGVYIFMTVYTNVSFMGFPVLESVIGPEALLYGAIFCMIFNVTCFSLGVKEINYPEKSDKKMKVADILLHPGVIGAVIALILYFINPSLPNIVTGSVSSVGKLTSTLAMILMGASLAKIPIKSVFGDFRPYLFIVIRQIIIPVLLWPLLRLCIKDDTVLVAALILIAMPIANMAVMFAVEYDRDEALAAKSVFLSTLLSIGSLPLVLYLTYLR